MRDRVVALLLMAAGLLCFSQGSLAQIHSTVIDPPRPAGWMVADVIPMRIKVAVDASHPLQLASLPPRGALNYWLDLRDVRVQERNHQGLTHYVIDLDYQTFYVPLDVQVREIPPLTLTFGQGEAAVSTTVAAWPFTVSPLRGISLHGPSRQLVPEPDAVQSLLSQRTAAAITATATGFLVLTLGFLARHYSVWPFHQRPERPFSKALRGVHAARREGSAQAYRQALRRVHRAFDATAHQPVLADDLERFIEHHPRFAPLHGRAILFFQVSREAFFLDDDAQAIAKLPWQSLTKMAQQLAAAERRRA